VLLPTQAARLASCAQQTMLPHTPTPKGHRGHPVFGHTEPFFATRATSHRPHTPPAPCPAHRALALGPRNGMPQVCKLLIKGCQGAHGLPTASWASLEDSAVPAKVASSANVRTVVRIVWHPAIVIVNPGNCVSPSLGQCSAGLGSSNSRKGVGSPSHGSSKRDKGYLTSACGPTVVLLLAVGWRGAGIVL